MSLDRAEAQAALADPSTTPETLAEIAALHADLWPLVTAHPRAYPDLVAWIASQSPDPVPEVVAAPPRRPRRGLLIGLLAGAAALLLLVIVPTAGALIALAQISGRVDAVDGAPPAVEDPTTVEVGCPDGSRLVTWSQWDGGLLLVCDFGTQLAMLVARGGVVDRSDEVTPTATGYRSPLAEVAFGGWAVWIAGSTDSVVVEAWGSSAWGDGSAGGVSIPACPAGSTPLSLSTWSEGWVLTCGTGQVITWFAVGDASGIVSGAGMSDSWGRWCGTDSSDRVVCVTTAPAVVQLGDTRKTLEATFVADVGPGGAGLGTGAYGLAAPGATAEEQVGYLVAILEKSAAARATVNAALAPLNACSVDARDIQALRDLTQARTDLLVAIRSTPIDLVPRGPQLLGYLDAAIARSEKADLGYVAAATRMAAGDCAGGRSLYRDAIAVADRAEESKASFVTVWNRDIADRFGVRTFSARDI